jgi:MinD superfamily P-loop ATPase
MHTCFCGHPSKKRKPSPPRFLKLTWKSALNAKNVLKYAGSGPLPFSAIRCSPFPNCATAAADAWRYARRGQSPKERELGVLETGSMNGVSFAHGRLRVGEAMSPPLIRAVRDRTWADGLTLIDAPPGTSCPVIAAMKDTDFVLLVTEPTPFGLHDLKLAVEAVKILEIPMGLVINRADMGDDTVRAYARAEGLPILMEIPFDRKIAESYSRGEMFALALPRMEGPFPGTGWKDRNADGKGGRCKMKELVILSGKGGTGKTSLTASFATLAAGCMLCDADVDAADLHLLMHPEIQKRTDFQGGGVA